MIFDPFVTLGYVEGRDIELTIVCSNDQTICVKQWCQCQLLVIMETGETVEKKKNSEKNEETVEEIYSERDLKSKSNYIKEHTFLTQTEALLSSNSKNELQDLFEK